MQIAGNDLEVGMASSMRFLETTLEFIPKFGGVRHCQLNLRQSSKNKQSPKGHEQEGYP